MRRDSTPILISTTAGNAKALERIDYSSSAYDENWLQRLLFDRPECLPISELEPGFGPIVSICRELPTSQGPLDNMFMTSRGDLILVEAKLWRNGEARREVVAQALDYASDILQWSFEELEQRVRDARRQQKLPDVRLYDLFDAADALDEAQFVDAVNTNLAQGRVLILIVGDGIRPRAEKLVELLQAHAGLHFRFALIELALFRIPVVEDILVVPRTLLQTKTIERGVVRIDQNSRPRIDAPVVKAPAPSIASSITAEQFFDAMRARNPLLPDALQALIADLEPIGVYPEFKRSLILRWDTPQGEQLNLGYIQRDGRVHADAYPPFAFTHPYIEDLGREWGLDVDRQSFGENWHLRAGKQFPRIEDLLPKLPSWKDPINRLVRAIHKGSTAPSSGDIGADKFTYSAGDNLLLYTTPLEAADWNQLATVTAEQIRDEGERKNFLSAVRSRNENRVFAILARHGLDVPKVS